MTRLFEEYRKFVNDCLGLVKDVLDRNISDDKALFDITPLTFILSGRTEEEKGRLKYQFYDSYYLELNKDTERRIRGRVYYRSSLIYLLALFERFREDFRDSWLKLSRENIDLFDRQVRDKLKKSKDSYQRDKYFDVVTSNAEEYINGIRKLNLPLLDIDRNLFGLRSFKDQEDDYLESAYANFVVAKELRNLLVHRSNILDEKFFDSLNHVLNGTKYKQNLNNRKELFKRKNLSFLNRYNAERSYNNEVIIYPQYILGLYLDLFIVSSKMVENVCKTEEQIEILQDIFGSFINDLVLLMNEFDAQIKYEIPLFHKFINQVERILTKSFPLKSDVLLVNQIVFKIKYKKFLEWALYMTNKEDASEAKKEFNKLEKRENELIASKLKKIHDKKIKGIAAAYIKEDDFELIAAIKAFYKNNEQPISTIDNWSIIQDRIQYSNLIREFRNLIIKNDKKKLPELMDELSRANDNFQNPDALSVDQ